MHKMWCPDLHRQGYLFNICTFDIVGHTIYGGSQSNLKFEMLPPIISLQIYIKEKKSRTRHKEKLENNQNKTKV